jgi:hypothetical protein
MAQLTITVCRATTAKRARPKTTTKPPNTFLFSGQRRAKLVPKNSTGLIFDFVGFLFGGCTRTRTVDPLIKSQLLYQLSYAPTVCLEAARI